MIWLAWRQMRIPLAAAAAALVALAATLVLTGPGLADDYSTGMATCAQTGDCSGFLQSFSNDNQSRFLAVTAIVLVLPAVLGLFWGAPLITRELEAGTHRLVWNQSVTRTRWLAVKLGLATVAVITVAGLVSLTVTWWADPLDKATTELPRMEPIVFAARGIVPIAYAAFAFALGVAVGMLIHRTLSAMAITMAVFIAVQVAVPMLVRPYLLPSTHSSVALSESRLDMLNVTEGGDVQASAKGPTGSWLLSSKTVDPEGNPVDVIPASATSGACRPSTAGPTDCIDALNRAGYRTELTYQPASRFWTFQWMEAGIYAALAAGLTGFSFWRIRRRRSF